MKGVRMKDIAREANVSMATVSYILNDVKNQKISADTRERVLDACKRMGYLPNLAARTLATKKSGLIGILNVKNPEVSSPWQDFNYCKFLNQLENTLSENGYHTLFTNVDINNPELNVILQRELDGVILLNIREEMFYRISKIFNVPIIIVDGYFEDTLFHKVIIDYDAAIKDAIKILKCKPEFVIADYSNNKGIVEKIKNHPDFKECDFCFVSTETQLSNFSENHKGQKGIVINEFIADFAARYLNPEDYVTICTCDSSCILQNNMKNVVFKERKSEVTANIILSYLNEKTPNYSSKYTVLKPLK